MGGCLGIGSPQTIFLSVSPVKNRNRGRMEVWVSTYPKRTIPANNTTVGGQIVVLELSRLSNLHKRFMPCKHPPFTARALSPKNKNN